MNVNRRGSHDTNISFDFGLASQIQNFFIEPVVETVGGWVNIIISVVAFLECCRVPFVFAFQPPQHVATVVWDVVVSVLFLLDACHQLRAWKRWRNRIVAEEVATGSLVETFEATRPTSEYVWLDCLSAVPLGWIAYACGASYTSDTVSGLRLLRLLRAPRFFSIISRLERRGVVGSKTRTALIGVLLCWLCMHLSACAWYYVSRTEDPDEFTWLDLEDFSEAKTSNNRAYLHSIFFATCTLSSLGFGDVLPYSYSSRAFVNLLMLLGATVVATTLGQMANLLATKGHASTVNRERTQELEEYVAHRGMPRALADRVQAYYHSLRYRNLGIDEGEILRDLPVSLRTTVAMYLYQDMIASVRLFQVVPTGFVTSIARVLTQRVCMAGDYIIRAGELGTDSFFLFRGQAEVLDDGGHVLSVLNPGADFGENFLMNTATRLRSVRAVVTSDVCVISKEDYGNILRGYPGVAKTLTRLVKKRARIQHPYNDDDLVRDTFLEESGLDQISVQHLQKHQQRDGNLFAGVDFNRSGIPVLKRVGRRRESEETGGPVASGDAPKDSHESGSGSESESTVFKRGGKWLRRASDSFLPSGSGEGDPKPPGSASGVASMAPATTSGSLSAGATRPPSTGSESPDLLDSFRNEGRLPTLLAKPLLPMATLHENVTGTRTRVSHGERGTHRHPTQGGATGGGMGRRRSYDDSVRLTVEKGIRKMMEVQQAAETKSRRNSIELAKEAAAAAALAADETLSVHSGRETPHRRRSQSTPTPAPDGYLTGGGEGGGGAGSGGRSVGVWARVWIDWLQERTICEPRSWGRVAWHGVVTLAFAYSIASMPLFIAFGSDLDGIMILFEIFLAVVYFLDVAVNFRTGFLHDGILIVDPKVVAYRYTKLRRYPADLISAFPYEILYASSMGFELVNKIKLLRLVKAFVVIPQIAGATADRHLNPSLVKIMKMFVLFLVLAHWLACGLVMLGEWSDSDFSEEGRSWLEKYGWDESPARDRYITSVYWTMQMLNTIAYGDITPFSLSERVLGIVIMLTAKGVGGMLLVVIALTSERAEPARRRLRMKMDAVVGFARARKLDRSLFERLQRYYEAVWDTRRCLEEHKMMKELPFSLGSDVCVFHYARLFQSSPILRACPPPVRNTIARMFRPVTIPVGETCYRDNERVDGVAFVLEGIMISRTYAADGGMREWTLQPGAVIGEMSPEAESITQWARPMTQVELGVIRWNDWKLLLEEYSDLKTAFMELASLKRTAPRKVTEESLQNQALAVARGKRRRTTLLSNRGRRRASIGEVVLGSSDSTSTTKAPPLLLEPPPPSTTNAATFPATPSSPLPVTASKQLALPERARKPPIPPLLANSASTPSEPTTTDPPNGLVEDLPCDLLLDHDSSSHRRDSNLTSAGNDDVPPNCLESDGAQVGSPGRHTTDESSPEMNVSKAKRKRERSVSDTVGPILKVEDDGPEEREKFVADRQTQLVESPFITSPSMGDMITANVSRTPGDSLGSPSSRKPPPYFSPGNTSHKSLGNTSIRSNSKQGGSERELSVGRDGSRRAMGGSGSALAASKTPGVEVGGKRRSYIGETIRRYSASVIGSLASRPVLQMANDSNLIKTLRLCLAVCALHTAVITPFRLAYNGVLTGAAWVVLDALVTAMYVIDLVVRAGVQVMHGAQREDVEQGVQPFWVKVPSVREKFSEYRRSGEFIPDVLGCLPLGDVAAVVVALQGGTPSESRFVSALRLVRVVKLYHLYKVGRYFEKMFLHQRYFVRILEMVLYHVIFQHWLACGFYLVSAIQELGEGEERWIDVYLADATDGTRYIQSLYWAIVSVAHVAFGDITPQSEAEKLFFVVIAPISVFVYSYVFGTIAILVPNFLTERTRRRQMLDTIAAYTSYYRLAPETTRRLMGYFDHLWNVDKSVDAPAILAEVPSSLRVDLILFQCKRMLAVGELFHVVEQPTINDLAQVFRFKICLPREYVYRTGEIAHNMFFVVDGEVEVVMSGASGTSSAVRRDSVDSPAATPERRRESKASGPDTDRVLAVLGVGSFFGEVALLEVSTMRRRTADVRATKRTVLAAVTRDDYLGLLQRHPRLREIMERVSSDRVHRQSFHDDAQVIRRSILDLRGAFGTGSQLLLGVGAGAASRLSVASRASVAPYGNTAARTGGPLTGLLGSQTNPATAWAGPAATTQGGLRKDGSPQKNGSDRSGVEGDAVVGGSPNRTIRGSLASSSGSDKWQPYGLSLGVPGGGGMGVQGSPRLSAAAIPEEDDGETRQPTLAATSLGVTCETAPTTKAEGFSPSLPTFEERHLSIASSVGCAPDRDSSLPKPRTSLRGSLRGSISNLRSSIVGLKLFHFARTEERNANVRVERRLTHGPDMSIIPRRRPTEQHGTRPSNLSDDPRTPGAQPPLNMMTPGGDTDRPHGGLRGLRRSVRQQLAILSPHRIRDGLLRMGSTVVDLVRHEDAAAAVGGDGDNFYGDPVDGVLVRHSPKAFLLPVVPVSVYEIINRVSFIICVYSIFFIPFLLSFTPERAHYGDGGAVSRCLEYLFDGVMLLELYVRLCNRQHRLARELGIIFAPWNGHVFRFHIIYAGIFACMPSQVLLDSGAFGWEDPMVAIVVVLLLLKMVARLMYFQLFFVKLSERPALNGNYVSLVQVVLWLLFLVHWFSCGWWVLGLAYGGMSEDPGNWIVEYGVADDGLASQYNDCVYYIVATITSVGYGDIVSTSNVEAMYTMALILCADTLFAFVFGSVYFFFYEPEFCGQSLFRQDGRYSGVCYSVFASACRHPAHG
eukprot:Rmarinus@m.8471